MAQYAAHMLSPIGRIAVLASHTGVTSVLHGEAAEAVDLPISEIARRAAKELAEYFARLRTSFTVPLDPSGTPFELEVYRALLSIPYGETTSYAELASMVSRPSAARAVGSALSRNPCLIIVPCHRVLPSSGGVGLFALGPSVKRFLLELESSDDLPHAP